MICQQRHYCDDIGNGCCCNVYSSYHELQKEARMFTLHHINVVTLFAIIFELSHYGFVMEYVLHGALDEFIYTHDV